MKPLYLCLSCFLFICSIAQGMDAQETWLNVELLKAADSGDSERMKHLIEAGANINARSGLGLRMTPILNAAFMGHPSSVQFLINAKANVNDTDSHKNTALIYAASNGHETCVRQLIAANAKVRYDNSRGSTAYMHAATFNNLTICYLIVEALLKIPNEDQQATLITFLGCAKKYKKLIFNRDIRNILIKHFMGAIISHNKNNFKKSIAHREMKRIKGEKPDKIYETISAKYKSSSCIIM